MNPEEGVNVKIRSNRDKFGFTVPAKILKKVNVQTGDYIKVRLQKRNHKTEYFAKIPKIPKSRTNLQLKRAVPEEFVSAADVKKDETLKLAIYKIQNKMSENLFHGEHIDVLAAIPTKSRSNIPIAVECFYLGNKEFCKIWYCNGQGQKIKPIILKRFIKVDRKLGDFFGLMQAESGKGGNKFDFTNKFQSEIELFIKIAKRFGIEEDKWKHFMHYSPHLDSSQLQEYLIKYSNHLKLKDTEISLIKNKNLENVVYNCTIYSVLLNTVMNSLLIKIREYLSKVDKREVNEPLAEFAIGFIIKDLLGDGTVIINKASGGLIVEISEQDAKAQKEIKRILMNFFRIKSNIFRIKINLSTRMPNLLWLIKNNAFKSHKQNLSKLKKFILGNFYFKILFERLNTLNGISIKEFAVKNSLSYTTARKYLSDNTKRGFVKKINNEFILTEKGRQFIRTINDLSFNTN